MNRNLKSIEDNSFAAACYNDNSIEELKTALKNPADKTDCQTWNLTETEYFEQIELALAHLMADLDNE